MRFRASELASALGTTLVGDDVTISGADFDSRTIERGQLFVPIVAARNGHDFVALAVESGAVAYLTSQGQIDGASGATAIPVADTAAA
ncbi:MAG: UDP-N-acetylmuramoylalanyl-D-glutamyl-2, 6-diaminopimelate--D-alanyl-D-alanine ligase, partial [Actinomycetota bacterium]|nr:UDP-N-acetylmuramoylalanyl-D-glutamyl-2, 6-diaminopimelate--D-alanyl-D-alanine ligase [Actinomycetota bacterium]